MKIALLVLAFVCLSGCLEQTETEKNFWKKFDEVMQPTIIRVVDEVEFIPAPRTK